MQLSTAVKIWKRGLAPAALGTLMFCWHNKPKPIMKMTCGEAEAFAKSTAQSLLIATPCWPVVFPLLAFDMLWPDELHAPKLCEDGAAHEVVRKVARIG